MINSPAFRACQIASEIGIPWEQIGVVGSTLICGKGNDLDLICLCSEEDAILKAGFESDLGDKRYPSIFTSYRRGDVNLLVTSDRGYFLRELALALSCREASRMGLDMSTREARISFHADVRYHMTPYFEVSPTCEPTS